MFNRKMMCGMLISAMALGPLAGCESMPGDKKTQGAVIGGAGGALAGAVIGKKNRAVGGLIGGALGAGGGYLIGSKMQKNDDRHRDEAYKASDRDRDNPPTASEARDARTADLNNDGFVTLNEVVAMQKSGIPNTEMIRRLEDTGQVFSLSDEQENYLRDKGVDREVIRAMRTINQDRARTVEDRSDRYDRSSEDRLDRAVERYDDNLDRDSSRR